jgi:hypothetical protein
MSSKNWTEQLAQIKRELEKQDAEWERAKGVLTELATQGFQIDPGVLASFEELETGHPITRTVADPPRGIRA